MFAVSSFRTHQNRYSPIDRGNILKKDWKVFFIKKPSEKTFFVGVLADFLLERTVTLS